MFLARALMVYLAAVIGQAQAASDLPSSDELAQELAPYLAVPLPSIEKLTGFAMPDPAPLLVVASFGNDNAVPDLDRGFAVGYTLNELLFDADPKLDVVPPWFYAEDTSKKGAPRGMVRDSTANAYRAAERDHARWCVHGRVGGASPTRVDLTVDGCARGESSRSKQWKVRADGDWPTALAEMCEYALANTAGDITDGAKASCQRARNIRPESLVAFARWAGPKENRAWKTLEAMYAADPTFAPIAVEYLFWLPYDKDNYDPKKQQEFWERVGAVEQASKPTSAMQLMCYARWMSLAWNIKMVVHRNFFAWLKHNPRLSSAWMISASALSAGNTLDYAEPGYWRSIADYWTGLVGIKLERATVPNEATHTAALALSLAVYRAWPESYRSLWQMGYALEQYGWMIRGGNFWSDVPDIGQRGFPVMISWANEFNRATIERHPDLGVVWNNRMRTAKLDDDDWLPIFHQAVEVAPWRRQIYYDAMNYALDQWGGDHELREEIQATAIAKHPNEEWPKTLVQWYEKNRNRRSGWLDKVWTFEPAVPLPPRVP